MRVRQVENCALRSFGLRDGLAGEAAVCIVNSTLNLLARTGVINPFCSVVDTKSVADALGKAALELTSDCVNPAL